MEEKWFKEPTWQGEPSTTKVMFIGQRSKGFDLIFKGVKQYLETLSMRDVGETFKNMGVCSGIVVDMSAKEFKLISHWDKRNLEAEGIHSAYPSQLEIYMQGHRGTITGGRFGL